MIFPFRTDTVKHGKKYAAKKQGHQKPEGACDRYSVCGKKENSFALVPHNFKINLRFHHHKERQIQECKAEIRHQQAFHLLLHINIQIIRKRKEIPGKKKEQRHMKSMEINIHLRPKTDMAD